MYHARSFLYSSDVSNAGSGNSTLGECAHTKDCRLAEHK